MNHHSVKILGS